MAGLGYLGLLESPPKLETRYIKIIWKKTQQKKKLHMNSLKHTETKNCIDKN